MVQLKANMNNHNTSPEPIVMGINRPMKSIMSSAVAPILAAVATDNQAGATDHVAAWKDKLIEYIISHAGALISALAVIIVGFVAARWIGKLVDRWLTHKSMEPPMRTLLVRIVRLL